MAQPMTGDGDLARDLAQRLRDREETARDCRCLYVHHYQDGSIGCDADLDLKAAAELDRLRELLIETTPGEPDLPIDPWTGNPADTAVA